MLTLAFAQIVWSIVFQWDAFTGGSNGLVGVWPSPWLAPQAGVLLPDARALRRRHLRCLRRMLFAPFGYALRAGRDSPLRAEAIGIDVPRLQWVAFVVAGALRRAWPARSSPSPRAASRPIDHGDRRSSIDGLVMVLLGGVADARPARWSARRSSPGCRTRSRAAPTTGAPCSAWSILADRARCSRRASSAALQRARSRAARATRMSAVLAGRGPAQVVRRRAGGRRRQLRRSTPASCWR